MLDTKLAAFAGKKAESLQAKSDFDALLEADSKKLVREHIQPEIEAFTKRLLPRLNTCLETWYAELRQKGSAVLQAGMEERTIDEVRRTFDAFRSEQEVQVSTAFEQLCGRFSQRLRQIVDELLSFSAGLFDIPFTASGDESPWRLRSAFGYKFWDMPPSLLLMRNALVLALPVVVGHPILLRDAKQRAADLISMQAGRLSFDFAERVKTSVREFRREMTEQVDATIAGIEAAIDKGKALRLQGEGLMRERSTVLSATLAHAQDLRERVDRLA